MAQTPANTLAPGPSKTEGMALTEPWVFFSIYVAMIMVGLVAWLVVLVSPGKRGNGANRKLTTAGSYLSREHVARPSKSVPKHFSQVFRTSKYLATGISAGLPTSRSAQLRVTVLAETPARRCRQCIRLHT